MANYYDVLGVRREDDGEAIKQAYHRLALEYHPDKNPTPEAAERMKQINEAYRVLGDPALKAEYDLKTMAAAMDSNPYARWYQQRAGERQRADDATRGAQAWTAPGPAATPGYEAPRRTVTYESVTLFSFEHIMAAGLVGLAFGIAITAAFVLFGIDPGAQYGLGALVLFATAASALPPLVTVWLMRRQLNAKSEAGLCGSISLAFALPVAVLAGSLARSDSTAMTCCLLPFICIIAGWVIGGFVARMGWDILSG
ncbi:MAG TPA: J domain-containing protein [Methanocella sp.]|nr:J domain-containing protein [Methanocella sp.]